LSNLRARRFLSGDFVEFDYLLAMDKANLADMLALKPDNPRAQADLLLSYSDKFGQQEIPDPYFGDNGFELVFDMIDDAARGLLDHIRRQHKV